MARPSKYSQALADTICARIAEGESLRSICADDGIPSAETVRKWLLDPARAEFVAQYMRAREEQADHYADEIVAIADEVATVVQQDGKDTTLALDATAIARNRLRIDARKWVAAKLRPKKWGEKVEVEHGGNVTLTLSQTDADL